MELHTPKYVKVLQYVVMIIMALFMFFPIYWIFVNSLKTITGISAWPPEFFPKDPQWGNYVKVLQNPNTLLYLRNTLVLVVLNTVGTLLTSSIVAYPLARMNFKGRGTVFAIILATMMVPSAALVIPQYLLFRNFGMLDSFWPLILPSFFAQPYNVFLFRQFFASRKTFQKIRAMRCGRIDGGKRFTDRREMGFIESEADLAVQSRKRGTCLFRFENLNNTLPLQEAQKILGILLKRDDFNF